MAEQLWAFNKAVNVPSKHFSAYLPTHWLDERTFSVAEASYGFVMMRKLSMELFELFKTRRIDVPEPWPQFKRAWLTWYPLIEDYL